jgi:hypothetical protein
VNPASQNLSVDQHLIKELISRFLIAFLPGFSYIIWLKIIKMAGPTRSSILPSGTHLSFRQVVPNTSGRKSPTPSSIRTNASYFIRAA